MMIYGAEKRLECFLLINFPKNDLKFGQAGKEKRLWAVRDSLFQRASEKEKLFKSKRS
jgi:hypothetical protein